MHMRLHVLNWKRRMLLTLCVLIPSLLLSSLACQAEEIRVSRFSAEGMAGWEPKSFKGVTEYTLVKKNGQTVVHAASHAAASGLIKKIHFAPAKFRYLRWNWKIAHTIKGGDEKSKAGDDFAARVYVVFPGRFFWQMKAISYIWANRLLKGESVPSAYSSNAKLLAVESGEEKAGQWMEEERDLLADYRTLFGTEPPEAEAVAIMTDTDNTGGRAEAWYGDITLSTEGR